MKRFGILITALICMNCLIDFIGLHSCKASEPESGLFINSLPGINLENIDKLADAEQVTYKKVWEDVQLRAVKKLNSAVVNDFSSRYRMKMATEIVNLGKTVNTSANQTAPTAEYRGFSIELDDANSGTAPSVFQSIHIQNLDLYLKVAQNPVTIKIVDLDNGEELKVISLNGQVGWNRIAVNESFDRFRVGVIYECSTISSPFSGLPWDNDLSCNCVCTDFCGCCSVVKGIKGTSLTAFEQENNTFGMSGVFTVKCSFDNLVCNSKETFATALFYLLGHELMIERMFTDRLNRFTTVDKAKAKEMSEYFGKEYSKELSQAIDGINLNLSDCCLECNAPIQKVTSLP